MYAIRSYYDAGARKALSRELKQLERDGLVARGKGGGYLLPKRGRTPIATVAGTLSLHRDGYGFVTPEAPEGAEDIVITSYSIHYTKLYDQTTARYTQD